MKSKWLLAVIGLIVLSGCGFLVVEYYSYLFARTVSGQVVGVEHVLQSSAIVGSGANAQAFSFAIAIKEPHGEIVTASSEDRQWAVVHKGQCAEAKFFPYPPWRLDKSGTFFGARLLKLKECS